MERKSKEQVAADILDAVIYCKYEVGGGPIQVTQVAARAGISTRTLNRYFPDKEAMIRTAAVKFLRIKYNEFAEKYATIDTSGLNGLERLAFFLRTQQDYYKSDPVNAVLFVDANLMCIRIGVSENKFQLNFGQEIREIVVSSLKDGIADGSIRGDIDPVRTSLLISANFNGLMQRLVFVFRSNLSQEQKEDIFLMFDEYQKMLECYLRP